MSIAMAKRHPLTPPEPDYGQLRPAPQHIFQSNPGRTHQQYYGLGDHSYLPSSTASYSSPAPGGRGIDELGRGYLHMGKADNGVWRQYVSRTIYSDWSDSKLTQIRTGIAGPPSTHIRTACTRICHFSSTTYVERSTHGFSRDGRTNS